MRRLPTTWDAAAAFGVRELVALDVGKQFDWIRPQGLCDLAEFHKIDVPFTASMRQTQLFDAPSFAAHSRWHIPAA
jgi:hypothetical protein